MTSGSRSSPIHRGLSARLLALTVIFVLIGEVLIYVPSIARFRHVFLEERIAAAHLATLALEAAPDRLVAPTLADRLVQQAGVLNVVVRRPQGDLALGEPAPVDAAFDLRDATIPALVVDAFTTLRHQGTRTIRVTGPSPHEADALVEIVLPEGPLWVELVEYSWRILVLSVVLSLIVAAMILIGLQWLIVRPLGRLTSGVIAFRRRPEDPDTLVPDTRRADEIGVVQRELRAMQERLRIALAQKARLAALGAAVGKINHDLRNLLSSAVLLSDRLERSQDPDVRRVTPRLVEALERATKLCAETLRFARSPEARPERTRFALAPLIEEVRAAVLPEGDGGVRWRAEVPAGLELEADRDQLFRVLTNLARNAVEALAAGGEVRLGARREGGGVVIEVADTGGGIPEAVRPHLFEAFVGSSRKDGSGLGLAIAREIVVAHGGDILLVRSGPEGTVFRIELPGPTAAQRAA
jgi:signal transduction histidine kinase